MKNNYHINLNCQASVSLMMKSMTQSKPLTSYLLTSAVLFSWNDLLPRLRKTFFLLRSQLSPNSSSTLQLLNQTNDERLLFDWHDVIEFLTSLCEDIVKALQHCVEW
jgi:hypothetical protein